MTQWKVVLAALVIFASGVVTGGLTVRVSRQFNLRQAVAQRGPQNQRSAPLPGNLVLRHEAQVRDLMRRMEDTLELRAEQRNRIQNVVADSQRRMQNIFQEMAPRTREEVRALHSRIRMELQPGQQREFDRLTRPLGRPQDGTGTPRFRPETPYGPISQGQ